MYTTSMKVVRRERVLLVIIPNEERGRSLVSILVRPCGFLCPPYHCGLVTYVFSVAYVATDV